MPCEPPSSGTDRLPPEHKGWRDRLNDPKEQFLDWLTPTMKADYIACEVDGKTRAERASERGVEPATVSASISRAKRRLQEIADDQGVDR